MYAVFCAPTNFPRPRLVEQAVRLAWRAAASLSALEVLAADAGGGVVVGGAGVAHDRPPASAEKASERATAGMKRMNGPRRECSEDNRHVRVRR